MNENGEKIMSEIASIVNECHHILWDSGLSQKKGVHEVGKFVVKSPPLSPCRESIVFKFWERGSGNLVQYSFYDHNFSIVGEQGNTVIANGMIHKIMKISANQVDTYPYIGFTWTREKRRGVPEETLSSLRFTLNSSTFIQYNYREDGVYKIMNHKNIPLSEIDLPEDLNKVTEIQGVSFEKRIDFDSMIEEIIMRSGIRELSDAINQITG